MSTTLDPSVGFVEDPHHQEKVQVFVKYSGADKAVNTGFMSYSKAFALMERAADFNPSSDAPYVVACFTSSIVAINLLEVSSITAGFSRPDKVEAELIARSK
tara:strand:+ start:555 stop:860 length:306 start_codon:yes stop_codon:yes gene_type:complete